MLLPCSPAVQPAPQQLTFHKRSRARRLRRSVLCLRQAPMRAPEQPQAPAVQREAALGQPAPASALRLSAREGLAAAKRLWQQQERPGSERADMVRASSEQEFSACEGLAAAKQPDERAGMARVSEQGLAAAKGLWQKERLLKEGGGTARAREQGLRLRTQSRRSRLWQAVAARLWRRVGLDKRSLRPLCRAFALDSLEQLQV